MRAKTRRRWGRFAAVAAFVLYLIILAYFLFFSERYGRGSDHTYHYNLTPFREIRRYFQYRHILGWEYFVVNIYGNVLAFMPFGFFLPVVSKANRGFFNVALYSFEFSLGVELVQLAFQVGSFDVDDLIMNTAGGILGYLFYFIFRKKLKHLL